MAVFTSCGSVRVFVAIQILNVNDHRHFTCTSTIEDLIAIQLGIDIELSIQQSLDFADDGESGYFRLQVFHNTCGIATCVNYTNIPPNRQEDDQVAPRIY